MDSKRINRDEIEKEKRSQNREVLSKSAKIRTRELHQNLIYTSKTGNKQTRVNYDILTLQSTNVISNLRLKPNSKNCFYPWCGEGAQSKLDFYWDDDNIDFKKVIIKKYGQGATEVFKNKTVNKIY
jgi:hypothetical protein